MLLALAFLQFSGDCPIRSETAPGIGSSVPCRHFSHGSVGSVYPYRTVDWQIPQFVFGIFEKTVSGDSAPRANATCKPDLHRADLGQTGNADRTQSPDTPFPDLPSASTMQPGLAYHKSKRKEK
jgi:hypothetical protein